MGGRVFWALVGAVVCAMSGALAFSQQQWLAGGGLILGSGAELFLAYQSWRGREV